MGPFEAHIKWEHFDLSLNPLQQSRSNPWHKSWTAFNQAKNVLKYGELKYTFLASDV